MLRGLARGGDANKAHEPVPVRPGANGAGPRPAPNNPNHPAPARASEAHASADLTRPTGLETLTALSGNRRAASDPSLPSAAAVQNPSAKASAVGGKLAGPTPKGLASKDAQTRSLPGAPPLWQPAQRSERCRPMPADPAAPLVPAHLAFTGDAGDALAPGSPQRLSEHPGPWDTLSSRTSDLALERLRLDSRSQRGVGYH
jgi:hypothetical protein